MKAILAQLMKGAQAMELGATEKQSLFTTTALAAVLGLVSCGGGGPLDNNHKNLRTKSNDGDTPEVNCNPDDFSTDNEISSFLRITSPDDPDCVSEELPDIVVKPREDDDGDAFTEVMQKALDIFGPKISRLYDAELEIYNKIDDEAVNAIARKSGNRWQIEMYGGMQRVKGMSTDAVTLVLCHELGHLIGGFPVISNSGDRSMSVEGNSDYFAAQACIKRMWQDEKETNAEVAEEVSALPSKLSNACRKNFAKRDDIHICLRTMAAIKSIQAVFKNTSLTTPSRKVVQRTQAEHPVAQCRIDTLIAGALCSKEWDFDRKFPKNPYDLRRVSCTRTDFGTSLYKGVRPLCWYQPKLKRANTTPKVKRKPTTTKSETKRKPPTKSETKRKPTTKSETKRKPTTTKTKTRTKTKKKSTRPSRQS